VSFDVAAALRKSTGRAKSDVANKLVSMFLHDVSRKACVAGGMTVSDVRYTNSVVAAFGNRCLYCGQELAASVVPVVEHLNGMNRVSVGLHVPGNVAMACKVCNNQKRDDDQKLLLAENGWESFLSHDGTRCATGCRTCAYWRRIWPEESLRIHALSEARQRVVAFQVPYKQFIQWSAGARDTLRVKIEMLYRDCQRFADEEIKKLVAEVNLDFTDSKSMKSKS
jgi:hypothetical protein